MMENPLHILETGTVNVGHGYKTNIRNGASHGKLSPTLVNTKVPLVENENVGLLSEIGVPILSSTTQDGVLFNNEGPASLLSDKPATLLTEDFVSGGEYENVTDVDVEKMDEWLKGRFFNTPSIITYEFDSEMRNHAMTPEQIFPDEPSLLEDSNVACKEELVSASQLTETEAQSSHSVKMEGNDSLDCDEEESKVSTHSLDINDECIQPSEQVEPLAAYSSPYIVDPSQLDLVEVSENQEIELVNQPLISSENEQCVVNQSETTINPADTLTTVSIQPLSKDYVLISIKSGGNEQIFKVKSSIALDPNQALTLENMISQPLILSQEGISNVPSEHIQEEAGASQEEAIQEESPQQAENVEVSPWIPTINRARGKVFVCPVNDCDMRFTKETKLRVHLLSHGANRSHKCTFSDCDWSFSSEYRLKRHLVAHMGKKNYTCSECGHKFTTNSNLKSHMSLHKREVNFVCPTPGCGMSFFTRRKMEFHLKEHSEMEPPYLCPLAQCGKRFYSANYLTSHLRVHQYSKEDLKCPIDGCGRDFERICQLKQHMRQHTGERPYVCNFAGCGWKFSSASKLTRHVRKHTGERRYTCPEPGCNKSFLRPEHLKGHIIIHSGSRPFLCEYPNCSARFTARSSLYVHMKKHTGDSAKAVFPCPVAGCIKKYNFKAHLRLHMLKVHASVLVGHNGTSSAVATALEAMDCDEDLEEAALDDVDKQSVQEEQVEESEPMNLVSAASTSESLLPETEAAMDVPQLLIQESLSHHLSPDLLALASEAHLTLTSDGSGQILINPSDLLSAPVVSDADQVSHSLLADMDQLLMGVGADGAGAGPTESPLDTETGVLTTGPAIEVADGGSARTDYSSNLILSSRAKRRRQLQQQYRQQELEATRKCNEELHPLEEPNSGLLSAADVVLTSSCISLRDSEITPPLLPVSLSDFLDFADQSSNEL